MENNNHTFHDKEQDMINSLKINFFVVKNFSNLHKNKCMNIHKKLN